MGGVEFEDGVLRVDREPNVLDELAIQFSTVLTDLGIEHVFVSGYVAILAGRARTTEDIDVLLERIPSGRIEQLVGRLEEDGLWGPAMPLEHMASMLEDNIWVARDGETVPHLEVRFVDDQYHRASLENRVLATLTSRGETLPIGPLELQIAYKLYLGSHTDLEDAVHLYTMFGETLSTTALERWVKRLAVEEAYERLKRA